MLRPRPSSAGPSMRMTPPAVPGSRKGFDISKKGTSRRCRGENQNSNGAPRKIRSLTIGFRVALGAVIRPSLLYATHCFCFDIIILYSWRGDCFLSMRLRHHHRRGVMSQSEGVVSSIAIKHFLIVHREWCNWYERFAPANTTACACEPCWTNELVAGGATVTVVGQHVLHQTRSEGRQIKVQRKPSHRRDDAPNPPSPRMCGASRVLNATH